MRLSALAASVLLMTAMAQAQNIHEAAKAGDLATVKKMIAEQPFMRKALDASGRSPAIAAAKAGQIPMVEYLLSTGIGVDDATPEGRTMLHEACDSGKFDMVKLLVTKHRASVTLEDKKKWSAIHFACRQNPPEMLKFIVDQRANVNATSDLGATPLIMAVASKRQPQVEFLIQRKADVNKPDAWNRTLLHIAAKNNDKVLLDLLIKSGAKCGLKDKDGKSALDEAIAAKADFVPVLEKMCTAPTSGGKSKNKKP